ncbi:MAG: hypothetical protein N2B02_05295, partial [Amylibacter sp.]
GGFFSADASALSSDMHWPFVKPTFDLNQFLNQNLAKYQRNQKEDHVNNAEFGIFFRRYPHK